MCMCVGKHLKKAKRVLLCCDEKIDLFLHILEGFRVAESKRKRAENFYF